MKRIYLLVMITSLILCNQTVWSQVSFTRGVNLTNWFQTSGSHQIQLSKYTKTDFANIKSLGCDVIRLPINLHFMTSGEPDYILDPLFLSFLDSAVTWAEELQIYLLLDNHTFDPSIDTDPSVKGTLIKVWSQMAAHYKTRSTYICYELLNEPHGISDSEWGPIQQAVIEAIREVDTIHTIVVGGAGWNGFNNLQMLPDYEDENLIYTFHFYEPFLFTHQGASWTDPSLVPLSGVPFPYHSDSMPDFPAVLDGTWIESSFNNYNQDGTVARVKDLIDIAVDFKNTRHVPIFCGEFGVYIPNSPRYSRLAWYDTVCTYLEANDIAWTTWDYVGSFGLFEVGGNDLFDYDLDTALIRSLGLTVPPQSDFITSPDTSGFSIYADYIENKISESSNAGTGSIDFYSENKPNNGNYCILWEGGDQYTSIGFDLKPNRDLSYLAANGFALDMMVRGTIPGTLIDIRFLDTKTSDPNDHPWRMRYTLNEDLITWNGKWQHLYLPFSAFTEQGAWDGIWYTPIGDFDWSSIDRIEIVADHHNLNYQPLWFDNIHITDLDTARIFDTSAIVIPTGISKDFFLINTTFSVYPNPATDITSINYLIPVESDVSIEIYNYHGQLVKTIIRSLQQPGEYSVFWNMDNDKGRKVPPGLYLCKISISDKVNFPKIIRL